VEAACNALIGLNGQVFAEESPLAEARAVNGLRAVFDEVGFD
jgi:hypothetical protein